MGLFDLFRRPPPIVETGQLADFIDQNAAFLVQKGIYEYSRARAGHYAKVLLREPAFLEAVEHSRWHAYPLGLAIVAEMVEGVLRRGESSVSIRDASIAVPEVHEDAARGPLALGVRPEHVTLSDVAPIRGRVFGTEYLGTNQIVTVDIEQGQIKARVPTRLPVRIGETVGLAFQPEHLVVFDAATGRATQSALYEDNGHG